MDEYFKKAITLIIILIVFVIIIHFISGCYPKVLKKGQSTIIEDEYGNEVWIECLEGEVEIEYDNKGFRLRDK